MVLLMAFTRTLPVGTGSTDPTTLILSLALVPGFTVFLTNVALIVLLTPLPRGTTESSGPATGRSAIETASGPSIAA